ncbi:MAG: class I SAM-dependent methyltransferase [Lachnospiraceae bacterium]
MDYNQKSKAAYNKKAERFNNTLEGKVTRKFHASLIANMALKDSDVVLDVACGTGTLLSAMAKEKDINGYGIDLSDQMIKVAAKDNPSMEFYTSDCEHLPFEDCAFDMITVCTGYHHFPDVSAFANESYRVLKDSGSIYIAEIRLPPIVRQICNLFMPLSKAGDIKIYSDTEITSVLIAAKFQSVKVSKKGFMQILQLKK